MKIRVITPNEDYRRQAGARIRYGRLSEPLKALGCDIDLVPLERVHTGAVPDGDVYLISKCYDVRAALVAQWARSAGRLVGVDLFDDYFSEVEDSRFAHLRAWFHACIQASDFVLCSTPALEQVSRRLVPQVPAHVMNDPFEAFDARALADTLLGKQAMVGATGVLQVAWFGMGDNPNFPVGLSDLVAFSGELDALRGHGLDVRLKICTNRRAMTAEALTALKRLPVPFEMSEWSEAAEKALLGESFAAFLPVNGQPFSTVKSLNRAVTALSAGVQVLSAGYPLYACFGPLIYRSGAELAQDAKRGVARLNGESVSALADALAQYADPVRETEGFAAFLRCLEPLAWQRAGKRVVGQPFAAVIHGRDSGDVPHDFARTLGALSVGTPLSPQKLDYDIRLNAGTAESGPELLVREGLVPVIEAGRVRWGRQVTLGKTTYQRVSLGAPLSREGLDLATLKLPSTLGSGHCVLLSEVARLTRELFPDIPLILSEELRQPWRIPAGFPGSSWMPH
ncbi:hypothetical protein [Aquabacter cavernae]|uniref:hypothetical protein n=1 Tax=Aquabacter cavernae TaxID=2496029 RepID=UPI000F8E190C|nr:hypothetical protein [Aquabacter cavernae]